jgi:hypothetical protein
MDNKSAIRKDDIELREHGSIKKHKSANAITGKAGMDKPTQMVVFLHDPLFENDKVLCIGIRHCTSDIVPHKKVPVTTCCSVSD